MPIFRSLSVDSPDAIFARARRRGSAGKAAQPHYPASPWPDIAPPPTYGAFITENFEDDGESEAYKTGGYGGWRIEVEADAKSVSVQVQRFDGTPGPRACKFCWSTIRPRKWSESGAAGITG